MTDGNRGRRGRRRGSGTLTRAEVVEVAIELLADPDLENNIPPWPQLATRAKEKWPSKNLNSESARIPYKMEGDRARATLVNDIIGHLQTEAGAAKLRRTGATLDSSLLDQSGTLYHAIETCKERTPDALAKAAEPFILSAFTAAYSGAVHSDSPVGSSHRARSILLAHHKDEVIRQITHRAIYERLGAYEEPLRSGLAALQLGIRDGRTEREVILDLGALLDGYLQQTVSAPRPSFDEWATRFTRSVIHFIASNVEVLDQGPQ